MGQLRRGQANAEPPDFFDGPQPVQLPQGTRLGIVFARGQLVAEHGKGPVDQTTFGFNAPPSRGDTGQGEAFDSKIEGI